MTFWRGLRIITDKEFRHLRHDPYTLILTVLMPLANFLLFGYALETRVYDVPTAIYNQDDGRFGRALVDRVRHSSVFRVSKESKSTDELRALLRRGDVRVAIWIPPGYSAAAFYGRPVTATVWIDGSDAALAGHVVASAEAAGMEQALTASLAGMPGATLPLQLRTELLYNASGKSANYFIPGLVSLLLQMTTLLLVSLSFVKERERGTLDQLRITTIGIGSLVAGKLAVCAVMGLATGAVLSILMYALFGIAVQGSVWLLAAALAATVFPALGIGLILTAEARNQAQALQLTYLVFIPSILISGFVFPRHTMPAPVAAISDLLPATWSIAIVRGVVLRGAGWLDVWRSFAAVAALGVLYLAIGTVYLRARLR